MLAPPLRGCAQKTSTAFAIVYRKWLDLSIIIVSYWWYEGQQSETVPGMADCPARIQIRNDWPAVTGYHKTLKERLNDGSDRKI